MNLLEITTPTGPILISPKAIIALCPFGECSSEITVEINEEQTTYQLDYSYDYMKTQIEIKSA